jgi:hypothetical protein
MSVLGELNKEPVRFVDATPDEEYPLRILRAYLENAELRYQGAPDGTLAATMNEMNERREAILRHAIAGLKKNQAMSPVKTPLYPPYPMGSQTVSATPDSEKFTIW